jgi:hypothetical protein
MKEDQEIRELYAEALKQTIHRIYPNLDLRTGPLSQAVAGAAWLLHDLISRAARSVFAA